MLKISAISNGITSSGGAKCRLDRLNADAVAENWQLLTQSVVNLVQSQVVTLNSHLICLQHICCDAALRVGVSAIADPCIA